MTATGQLATHREQALWMLERLAPGTAANNLSVAFQVDGRLDPRPLSRALDLLLSRHTALRSVFRADGIRLSREVTAPRPLTLEEITPGPGGLLTAVEGFARIPYGWDGDRLVRAALFHGPEGDAFCLGVHHAVFDVVSGHFVLEEIVAGYDAYANGLQPALPPVTEDAGAPGDDAASLGYWQKHLDGYQAVGAGGTDGDELAGVVVTGPRSPEAKAAAARMQKDLRAPEGAILLAAYAIQLARHGSGADIVIGVPANVRGAGQSRAVGYHVNVLAPRLRFDEAATFRSFARQARDVFLGALMHAAVSAERLLPGRLGSGWRNPLFRHMFNYVPGGEADTFTIGGLTARRLVVETGCAKTDLELFVRSDEDWLQVRACYHPGALRAEEASALIAGYASLLERLADRLDEPMGKVLPPGPQMFAVTDSADAETPQEKPADDGLIDDLVALWSEVLKRDDVGADSNFFVLGGVSLLAALLAKRVKDRTGLPVRLADVFHAPTPAGLAARISSTSSPEGA